MISRFEHRGSSPFHFHRMNRIPTDKIVNDLGFEYGEVDFLLIEKNNLFGNLTFI